MQNEEILFQLRETIRNAVYDAIAPIISDEVEYALHSEREKEQIRAVSALCAVQRGDSITDLLCEMWGMDQDRAKMAIHYENGVRYPMYTLRHFLYAQDYPPQLVHKLFLENKVENRFITDPSLSQMINTPEALLQELGIKLDKGE